MIPPGWTLRILADLVGFEDYQARHPIRSEINGQGIEVFYIRYDPYWFACGVSKAAGLWTQMSGWKASMRRMEGVVWC